MNIKKITAVVICFTLLSTILSLTACDKKDSKNGGDSNNVSQKNEEENEEKEEIGNTPSMKEMILAFVNQKYVDTGDETLPKFVEVKDELKIDDINIESQIMAAIKMLQTLPTNQDNLVSYVNDAINVEDVTIDEENHSAILNIHLLSSDIDLYTEQFFVYQVVDTVIKNFDKVNQVEFKVDGKKVDTLAGHMDISKPFTLEMVKEFQNN